MKKPMRDKNPEILKFIEGLFPGTTAAIDSGQCACCHKPIGPFRNAISEREYQISGMCQACQDSVFGED